MRHQSLLHLSNEFTQLHPWGRRKCQGDDTATVLALDRRRGEGFVYVPQIG